MAHNAVQHDLHLSALSISLPSRVKLENAGFVRDEFANNRRCVASEYHASYAGKKSIPDDALWQQSCDLLLSDPRFAGHLEEERTVRRESIAVRHPIPGEEISLAPFTLEPVPAGKHKACDVHLGIELGMSSQESVQRLETLGMISFERHSQDGVRRIYTVTCESETDGYTVFDSLLAIVRRLQECTGSMKLELISRYLRHPSDVDGLPILSRFSVAKWLAEIRRQS